MGECCCAGVLPMLSIYRFVARILDEARGSVCCVEKHRLQHKWLIHVCSIFVSDHVDRLLGVHSGR